MGQPANYECFDAAEVRFDAGESKVAQVELRKLRQLACRWEARGVSQLMLVGHASKNEPNPGPLAELRAVRVKLALADLGVPLDRIYAEGKANLQPVVEPRSPLNQRVEIVYFCSAGPTSVPVPDACRP
jgi:outer membrane protein OmpA-like peptidoglycan-associated protein